MSNAITALARGGPLDLCRDFVIFAVRYGDVKTVASCDQRVPRGRELRTRPLLEMECTPLQVCTPLAESTPFKPSGRVAACAEHTLRLSKRGSAACGPGGWKFVLFRSCIPGAELHVKIFHRQNEALLQSCIQGVIRIGSHEVAARRPKRESRPMPGSQMHQA